METMVTAKRTNLSGITLLEMTIVILIIALLVGGVTIGRTLIGTAENQAVIREHSMYLKAINEFKDKYNELPGDMLNATTLWGTDPLGCAIGVMRTTPLSTTETCNGNGNGNIGSSTANAALGTPTEWFRTWKHLANAGFIDGKYTGTKAEILETKSVVAGQNVPASDVDGAGWTLFYLQATADTTRFYGEPTGGYGHVFSFGANVSTTYTYGAILTATAAASIDSKMDDGKPGLGNVRAFRSATQANCTENDTSQSAQTYKLNSQILACGLLFILGF